MYSPSSSFTAIHDDGSQSSAGAPMNHSASCILSASSRNLVEVRALAGSHTMIPASKYDKKNALPRMSLIVSNRKLQQQQQRQDIKTPSSSVECLRFKYFTTFLVSAACLVLLTASLATNKWLVSRPIRIVRLANGLPPDAQSSSLVHDATGPSAPRTYNEQDLRVINELSEIAGETVPVLAQGAAGVERNDGQLAGKFQGRIYFGLFSGLKVLNYGFGERVNQLSVAQKFLNLDVNKSQPANKHELVNYKSWLLTLFGVLLATLFALIGAIFAIINFVMIPKHNAAGPIALITWNSAACAACTLSVSSWLLEYLIRLKWSVLSLEEIQNGWTSENRSQCGYSFYFVCAALLLHLVNIIIVAAVQSNTWTSATSKSNLMDTDQRAINEGVVMLY